MKRAPWGAALAVLTGCSLAGPSPGEPEPRPVEGPAERADQPAARPYREVRGLWVVRTSLTSPERVRAAVREAADAGFNALLVQVRGRADAYYRSTVEPRAAALRAAPADFDPLALVIAEARARGLGVHAWLSVNLVWGVGDLPDDPEHLVRARPDLLAVPRELARELLALDPRSAAYLERLHAWTAARRERLEGLYADPAHPEAAARLRAVVADLADGYDLDGIHLDYVRYPSPEFGFSRAALEAFAAWMEPRSSPQERVVLGGRMADDPFAWVDAHPEEFQLFRRERVTALVGEARAALRERGGRLVLSAAVFADPTDAVRVRFQDWPSWLAGGLVDVVVPMAYTADAGRFRDLAESARRADARAGERVWMGIGAHVAPFGTVVREAALARGAGARGVVVFSYDWVSREALPVDGLTWLEAFGRRVLRR
jgi:uncharacterized lipoprotein YddW (UPF0748 family)